jgi:hypothetical protein
MSNTVPGALGFPPGWPKGCPPPDAYAVHAFVYHLCSRNPLHPDDFLSQAERGAAKTGDSCLRVGISVLLTYEDAAHHLDLFPRLGPHIALGMLTPESGVLKEQTGNRPGHATWWPYDGVDRCSLFGIVS